MTTVNKIRYYASLVTSFCTNSLFGAILLDSGCPLQNDANKRNSFFPIMQIITLILTVMLNPSKIERNFGFGNDAIAPLNTSLSSFQLLSFELAILSNPPIISLGGFVAVNRELLVSVSETT